MVMNQESYHPNTHVPTKLYCFVSPIAPFLAAGSEISNENSIKTHHTLYLPSTTSQMDIVNDKWVNTLEHLAAKESGISLRC